MVSPGSGSWAYTTSPRASAAYLDMPTVPRKEHIYYGSPIHCDSSIDLFIFLSLCIPVGFHTQPIINTGKMLCEFPTIHMKRVVF